MQCVSRRPPSFTSMAAVQGWQLNQSAQSPAPTVVTPPRAYIVPLATATCRDGVYDGREGSQGESGEGRGGRGGRSASCSRWRPVGVMGGDGGPGIMHYTQLHNVGNHGGGMPRLPSRANRCGCLGFGPMSCAPGLRPEGRASPYLQVSPSPRPASPLPAGLPWGWSCWR